MSYLPPLNRGPRLPQLSPDASLLHTDVHTLPGLSSLPRVGQTRCYWVLLSSNLEFLFLDPVLTSHLGQQANSLLGKCVLDFVHPEEQHSARSDLRAVLDSRTLHGSVTRVRYARLSRVRQQLGYTGPVESFPNVDKVVFDDNYVALDLVINWAADGLVLCFMHAVVDISPEDNNERNKTDWTNWCGTPLMTHEHSNSLYQQLFSVGPPESLPPSRVFQILSNQPDRTVMFSWPVEGYAPVDYGKLARDVQIGGSIGSDAKTSCTRRYKSQQVMACNDGSQRDVESIFIPHGCIIFACHKSTPQPAPEPSYATYSQQVDSHFPPVLSPSSQYGGGFPRHLPPPNQPAPHYNSPSNAYPSSNEHWGMPSHHQSPQAQYSGWSGMGTSSPPPARISRDSYPQHPPPTQAPPPQQQWAQDSFVEQQYQPPYDGYNEVPPPPKTRQARTSGAGVEGRASPMQDSYIPGGRSSGNPPQGIQKCSSCKITQSPEWRKGPSGKKDLCNACGLRYARSKAKKEGLSARQRKTGKATTTQPKTTLRREESIGASGSVGGGSVGAFSPSPSPPRSTYAGGTESYGASPSYGMPGPPPQHHPGHHSQQQHHGGTHSPPPHHGPPMLGGGSRYETASSFGPPHGTRVPSNGSYDRAILPPLTQPPITDSRQSMSRSTTFVGH